MTDSQSYPETAIDPLMTPKEFVDSIISSCDPSNWDAERNTGDYFRGLKDAYEAIHEIANEYQTAMYAWTRPGVPAQGSQEGTPSAAGVWFSSLIESLRPFAYYFDLNDCEGRSDGDALEIPVSDLRAARDLLKKLGIDTSLPPWAPFAARLADVVMMLDNPDCYNRVYIAAVCRSILSSVSSTTCACPTNHTHACRTCYGDGYINIHANLPDVKCEDCSGTGRGPEEDPDCRTSEHTSPMLQTPGDK